MNKPLLGALLLALPAAGLAKGAEEAAAWAQPFKLQLPPPARQLILAPDVDATTWVAAKGLNAARILPRGRQGAIVELPMEDTAWAQVQESLCGSPEVSSCETSVCQTVQLQGEIAAPGSEDAGGVQARLVKNPPETVPEPGDAESGTCRGPALAGLLDAADPAAGSGLTLDLSVIGRDGGSSNSRPQGSAPAAGKRSFELALQRRAGASGSTSLSAEALPADTSDWTLVAGADCAEVQVPLDALTPARMPGVVLALVDQTASGAVAAAYGLTLLREIRLDSTGENLVLYLSTAPLPQVLAQLALDGRVRGAQPDHIFTTTAEAGTTGDVASSGSGAAAEYSDPYAALTYGPDLTGARALQQLAGGSGALIAVIDTGVAQSHTEFKDRLEAGVDTTGSGWSEDVHGTAIAGIIAAAADNGVGSYGVAPRAKILPIKACEPKEAGSLGARCRTSALVKALDVAIQRDAAIINMSLAGPPDDLLARFVALAVSQDRLVVAGAGNGGAQARPAFPAALPGVIAVTAVDAAGRLFDRANEGSYIDLAAPGVDIVAPVPGDLYPALSGTSMAAAHVSGVLALLKDLIPAGLDVPGTISLLQGTSRDLGAPGADPRFGAGLIDACAAVAGATARSVACPAALAGAYERGVAYETQNAD
ncbi:MAG: S8 family serine peptidase [Pseudomonadales bacterium]